MKPVELGNVCPDCFNAINYNSHELWPEAARAAEQAGAALSSRVPDNVVSLHTESFIGFSYSECDGCGNKQGGERWPLRGLENRKDN